MNTLLVAVFAVTLGASYGFFLNNLPYFCKVDGDCGANKCCAFGRFCSPKLGANMPCDGLIGGVLKCGCGEGLECKVVAFINATIKGKQYYKEFKQCKGVGESVVPVEMPVGKPRQKRFLNPIIRSCSANSDCGIKRCCLDLGIFKKCSPTLPLYAPCNGIFSQCCQQGLVCRSILDINVGGQGGDQVDLIDVKTCQKPPTPTPEVDES